MALTKVIGAGVGSLTEDLALSDSDKIKLGAGSDLQLYHDGSHSYIDEVGTGSLYVRASIIRWTNADGSETLGGVDADGGWFLKANNSNALVIDTNGHVTKPLQPAFNVNPSTTQSNIPINGLTTILFPTERFDNNSDFASNTFTAPVTGKYQLQVNMRLDQVDKDNNNIQLHIVTSNKTYYSIIQPAALNADAAYWWLGMTALADMDANDTAYIQIYISNDGTAQMDVDASSYFSGHLVC